jgi:signal transduction histidine kinase
VILSCNGAVGRLTHSDPDALLGKAIWEETSVVAPEEAKRFRERLDQVAALPQAPDQTWEASSIAPDGSRRSFVWSVSAEPGSDGVIEAFCCIAVACPGAPSSGTREQPEHHAYVRSLDALLARVSRPEEVLDQMSRGLAQHLSGIGCTLTEVDVDAGVAKIGRDYRVGVRVEPRSHVLTEVVTDTALRGMAEGRPMIVEDVLTDPRVAPFVSQYTARGTASFVAVPHLSEGKWRATLVVADAHTRRWREDEVELIREVVARAWPVIEQLRSHRTLLQSREFFRRVIDAVPSVILVRDAAGQLRLSNHAAVTALGDWGALPEATNPEAAVTASSGATRWYSVVEVPLPDSDGNATERLTVATDVTDRKQAELERVRLIEELNEAICMRDDFLTVAGHELKTPVSALRLQLARLERFVLTDEQRAGAVALASRTTLRLTKMVSELLDVTRIRAGRLSLEREPVDLRELLTEVADHLVDERERSGSTLHVDVSQAITGRWDRGRLSQVLTNLLSNAIKYGAGRPIDVAATATGQAVRITVTDHGIGIEASERARIFARFERAVSGTHYRGLGLGLWIAREIVTASGGQIWVTSELGRGSVFGVELPLDIGESQS